MQYSVSPRVNLSELRAEAERERQHADADAARHRKWPSSCTKISTPSTNRNARMLVTRAPSVTTSIVTRRSSGRELARPAVDRPDVGQAPDTRAAPFALVGVHRQLDDVGNRRETPAARRGTPPPRPRWRRSARPAARRRPRSARKASARHGNRSCPARSNSSRPARGQVQRRQRRRPPLRIREGVLDRQPHVRHAELRDHRAVDELDHRMHDRLRVDERRRSGPARRRTASAPRSPRGPCSSASPSRW